MSSLAQTALIDRVQPQVRAEPAVSIGSRIAVWAIAAMAVVVPFERALVDLPGGFTITTVEAVTLAALVAVTATWFLRPVPVIVPFSVAVSGAAFIAALLAAAVAAPSDHGNAFRFVGRMAVAALVMLATGHAIDTIARARAVVRAFVAVAAIVAAIAILEAAQQPLVMNALTAFRPGFHVVAGQLRATSTLFYPTIASMYLEVAFALGLWLLLDPGSRRPAPSRAAAFAALTIIGAGIAATFTRAGLIGMAASLVLVAALRLRTVHWKDAGVCSLGALAAVLVAIVFLSHSPTLLAIRLSTEGSDAWYGATYQAPATLRLDTGRQHQVPIAITNTGRIPWDSTSDPPFALSYHWLRSGSGAVIQFDGQRTAFPAPVLPRSTVSLRALVTAPVEPGSYTLVWDVVHETRAWLSTEGVVPARTDVRVEGAPKGTVTATMAELPRSSLRPPRLELWRAALAMSAERPLLGHGPDSFRHAYGRYLGLDRWDSRVHANDMYLEVLAGAGIAGLIALLCLVLSTGRVLIARCRQLADPTPAAVMLAVWMIVAGHGLVDSFLSFTTTYVTFALAAGIAFSRAFLAPTSSDLRASKDLGDAHCV